MTYLVTVGLSPATSPSVLRWARGQATSSGGRLRVVRAWRPAPVDLTVLPVPVGADRQEHAAHAELADQVRLALGPDPGVELELEIVLGGRRRVLLAESADADLLVLGSPRPDHDAPLQLIRLLAESRCPVVVLPAGS